MWPSSTVGCFFFTSTRLFSISFDLKKSGKVSEEVEQFKERGIVPMRIILESVSLFELQIDLAYAIIYSSSKFFFLWSRHCFFLQLL